MKKGFLDFLRKHQKRFFLIAIVAVIFGIKAKQVRAFNPLIIIALVGLLAAGGSCGGCGGDEGDEEGDGTEKSEDIPTSLPPVEAQTVAEGCIASIEIPDGKDNDCDNKVDEEDCGDGIDNDGDGFVDEDC